MTRVPPHPPTADQNQTAPEGNEKKGNRVPEHLVLGLTLFAIAFAALRIVIVSRGDSDTMRALVQNLNVTAIVLASILPLVTTTIWLSFVLLLLVAANNARKKNAQTGRSKGRAWTAAAVIGTAIIFGPLMIGICWFAMQMKYVIFAGILSVVLVVVYLGSWHGQQFKSLFQAAAVLLFIIIFIAGPYVVIAQVGIWLPRERLTLGSSRTGTVYVLSSDERWTKYLDGETHKVRIVQTKDVLQRETITESDTWLNQAPSELWSREA